MDIAVFGTAALLLFQSVAVGAGWQCHSRTSINTESEKKHCFCFYMDRCHHLLCVYIFS